VEITNYELQIKNKTMEALEKQTYKSSETVSPLDLPALEAALGRLENEVSAYFNLNETVHQVVQRLSPTPTGKEDAEKAGNLSGLVGRFNFLIERLQVANSLHEGNACRLRELI
jgi:hypothetical protein